MKMLLSCISNRKLLLFVIDTIVCISVVVFSMLISVPNSYNLTEMLITTLMLSACIMLARVMGFVYRKVWRYARANEYVVLVLSDYVGALCYLILTMLIAGLPSRLSLIRALSVTSINCLASVFMRSVYQVVYCKVKNTRQTAENTLCGCQETQGSMNKLNVAIVGAGSTGTMLASELKMNANSRYLPYCFIDNDPQKIGNSVSGLKVYSEKGIIERLKTLPVHEIIIALPGLSGSEKERLYHFYKQSNCKVKLYDFPFTRDNSSQGEATKRVLREFEIEDLLFREPINIQNSKTASYYKGKTVLITGGGGSIGSELSRQIASFEPKRLIILDIYENNAYDIQQELKQKYGSKLDLCIEISSVREEKRIDEVFDYYRPDIVLHAAAHKHVPLMEHNAAETIKNNVFGTYYVANAAEKYGCSKFILISSDKAVNPTNIMGASKRMCEMIIESRRDSKTNFAAVRFGNVLGSNGSVIPLFKRQIAAGGPVTITDKRIIRYFMTIPEAAQLVLQAGVMARKGELFVLDMGKPVKILELAENMIRLSGLEPYVDIDIKEIGLREGEKLYEELLIKTEELDRTENKLIFIERDKAPDRIEVERKLAILKQAAENGSTEAVKTAFRIVVPTYHSPEEINRNAENAEEMRAVRELEPQMAVV
jgi:FlaA1/EpsC-like NDP-sugar epimerase